MKVPIIIDNCGDVLVFSSVAAASSYMEAVDVLNAEYVGYDCDGRLLDISVAEQSRVTISIAEDEPSHCDALRKTLVDFLTYMKVSKDWLSAANLEELVTEASKFKVG